MLLPDRRRSPHASRVVREVVLSGVRAVLRRQIDGVPPGVGPLLPVRIGEIRLCLCLTANETEFLEQRVLLPTKP
jgi:hypothetical protein